MNNWEAAYQKWLHYDHMEVQLQEELLLLRNKTEMLEDTFRTFLNYENSGMSAVRGPGTNRLNTYTIRRAVKGLIHYIQQDTVNYQDRGVVLAYDGDEYSKGFALECAKVLAAYGIKSYVFSNSLPSSLLSFAVRYLGAAMGVMVSADDLDREVKYSLVFYNEYGSQMSDKQVGAVSKQISRITDVFAIRAEHLENLFKSNLFEWINGEVVNAYIEQLIAISKLNSSKERSLTVGVIAENEGVRDLIQDGLNRIGFHHVFSQISVKGNERKSDALNQDLILLADDKRLSVKMKNHQDQIVVLEEEELGILLLDFCLSHTDQQVLDSARVVKSSKATEMERAISEHYNVAVVETAPGFQHIDEQINLFDETGETFIFGLGENNEYLIDSFVRDKDFIQTAIITCEMAEYWKRKHYTLDKALEYLNRQYQIK